MVTEAAAAGAELAGEGLVEARRLPWRERATEATLRRDGRRWTLWTAGILLTFGAPAVVVMALEPWLFPVALVLVAHAWLICRLQAGRAVTSIVPLGSWSRLAPPPSWCWRSTAGCSRWRWCC